MILKSNNKDLKEDVFISGNKLKRKNNFDLDLQHNLYKKVCKFNEWYSNLENNLIK